MDPYQALANNQLDRELAMTILMNNAASDALKMSRMGQQSQQNHHQQHPHQHPGQLSPHQHQQLLQSAYLAPPGAATTARSAYTQDMVRLQRELINRELAARSAAFNPSFNPTTMTMDTAALFARAAALNNPAQHPSFSTMLKGPPLALPGSAGGSNTRNSPPLSPSTNKTSTAPSPPGILPAGGGGDSLTSLKRTASSTGGEGGSSSVTSGDSSSQSTAAKKARVGGGAYPTSPGGAHQQQQLAALRGSKAKLRDDFWGKVGKNNSHIHLVNIVLGRLLFEQVKNSKGGNKVLSNDLIQQILEHKLYGKYAVREFFASGNKASETVRNTWTRLNFASDNIRKGLSRYKEQTWQAIVRCEFENVPEEEQKEMDDALKVFVQTGRFVAALDVALKGIITEQFMGVLMQLRLEWNSLCLNCRPQDHDSIVAAFLRKYGLNGK